MKYRGSHLPFSWQDTLKTILILGLATLLCSLLKLFNAADTYVPMIFVLAVVLISRFTNGYLYGAFASVAAVFGVNYAFTFPYFHFDFSIAGYPITFFTMFSVSVIVSMLTTQIKEQEKMRAEIEKEKMRSNLLRAVSHDIRTPLTSIMGSASACLENYERLSDRKKIELMEDVRNEAQWLLRIVENLLSVTRIGGDKAKIEKEPEAVEEIIGEIIRKFKKRFPEAEIAIHIPPDIFFVPMDAILIEQVIINLLENAMIHGKPSHITVTIVKRGQFAVFTVEDDGAGIDEAVFPHLFSGYPHPSSPGDSNAKRNMGIGLSVCLSIIKAHGGTMTAKNRKTGGAMFQFTLPLEKEADLWPLRTKS